MPDTSPSTDLNVQEPGGDGGVATAENDLAAKIAALEATNAQLQAALDEANATIHEQQTVPVPLVQPAVPRLIGEDWSSRTAAEAEAAGVAKTVLCKDGYFVPKTLCADG